MRISLIKSTILAFILILTIFCPFCSAVEFQTYVTAQQVDTYLSTKEGLEQALSVFNDLDIKKVYIETLRSGHQPALSTLKSARDYFESHGLRVSGGITTTHGNQFGTPTNGSGYWLNYQNAKTQQDLRHHIERIAPLFDEIMIDDFFATDDQSEESIKAKGERSWPDYRMDLMMKVAQNVILSPARKINPKISFILKFPQWYDRFHRFGYDVARSPGIFDRIWVGTETRRPDTQRFGYVMPNQGFINYSWLKSIAVEKIGGGWFDFGDCSAPLYLMQAYQTVLAGADEIVLFEAGSLIKQNQCLSRFTHRQKAVSALSNIVKGKSITGITAYKPPHSEGSDSDGAANLYVYDYLAMLGIPTKMTAQLPEKPKAVFLPRQAAEDPSIAEAIDKWIDQGVTLIITPDFLVHLDDNDLYDAAGYEPIKHLSLTKKSFDKIEFKEGEDSIEPATPINIRPIPKPKTASILCSAKSGDIEYPLLTQNKGPNGSKILVLNIQTFTHEEFSPNREQFLPPRPAYFTHWNAKHSWAAQLGNVLRHAISSNMNVQVNSSQDIGIYDLKNDTIVLSNFSSQKATCSIKHAKKDFELIPDKRFPHAKQTQYKGKGSFLEVTIPAWEIVVLQVIKNQ